METAVARATPAAAEVIQKRDGVLYLDLPRLVQTQLAAAGVQQIEIAHLCPACHTDEWFSHRAEHGHTGRFGVMAMLQ
jgi:copper oxidase (laccase) domain-containing protein